MFIILLHYGSKLLRHANSVSNLKKNKTIVIWHQWDYHNWVLFLQQSEQYNSEFYPTALKISLKLLQNNNNKHASIWLENMGLFSVLTWYVQEVCSNNALSNSSSNVWTCSTFSCYSPASTQIWYDKHHCLISCTQILSINASHLNHHIQLQSCKPWNNHIYMASFHIHVYISKSSLILN